VATIRLARGADADRCAALTAEALAAVHDARGGDLFTRREVGLLAKALLRPGGLDRLLADPRRRIVVAAADDGTVVGVAVGRVDPVGEAALGVIDALYVAPPARATRIGRALLDDLLGWFRISNCRGVDASALPGDRAAKSFFEAEGFKGRLITMHRPLP